MKITKHLVENPSDEAILIYHTADNGIVERIENLVAGESLTIVGYDEDGGRIVPTEKIECFYIEDTKVYFRCESGILRVKGRLYELEATLPVSFVKINQSTIINSTKIKRFDATLGGTLTVTLMCGFKDYVSRRSLKAVKERLGIK